jgi:hypothetical protein
MLDLCAGKLGIAREFALRGWTVTAVDIVIPPEIPFGMKFIKADILSLTPQWVRENFDFGWASTPCENFSVYRMKMFHPNPPYPALGVTLFNHARWLYETAGIPYIMENVQTAQDFIGQAVNHAGSFYLWGNSVPPLIPKGLTKGMKMDRKWCQELGGHGSAKRDAQTAGFATIPPELANCVAAYAERLLELEAIA